MAHQLGGQVPLAALSSGVSQWTTGGSRRLGPKYPAPQRTEHRYQDL